MGMERPTSFGTTARQARPRSGIWTAIDVLAVEQSSMRAAISFPSALHSASLEWETWMEMGRPISFGTTARREKLKSGTWTAIGLSAGGQSSMSGATSFPSDRRSSIVGMGDLDGRRRGKADIVWHSSQSGEVQIWFMDGHRILARHLVRDFAAVCLPVSPWRIVGTGDFGPAIPPRPNGPSDLKITNVADREISISWTDHSTVEREFQIRFQRGTREGFPITLDGEPSAATKRAPL